MKGLSFKQFIGIINRYRPSRLLLGLAFLLTIIQSGVSLFVPLIAMNLVDLLVIEEINVLILLGLVALFMFQIALSAISYYMMVLIGEKIIVRLREDLWNKVIRFPVRFFDSNNSGEIMSKLQMIHL